jgi:A/G-specific adenine glycosylase
LVLSHPFTEQLIIWQKQAGRHDLPWQKTRDPYRIWLSEIMLQQTQVVTVIPYYQRFLDHFPNVLALAAAPIEQVIELWAGLGYYARARNLHRCARQIATVYGGFFPKTEEQLVELAGIGRSTAAAIAAFAFGQRAAILDGNVKRVLCRQFGIEGFPGSAIVERKLWALAVELLPDKDIEAYTQGLMDLGSTCCTRRKPQCAKCPVSAGCIALRDERQHELPEPKPPATIPHRSATFALIFDGQRLLLERRPPTGIWGGLLVPPEGDIDHTLTRLGLCSHSREVLPELKHAFTHYRLTLQPVLCRVVPQAAVSENSLIWIDLSAAAKAGVPTPIAKLIRQITAG